MLGFAFAAGAGVNDTTETAAMPSTSGVGNTCKNGAGATNTAGAGAMYSMTGATAAITAEVFHHGAGAAQQQELV